MHSAVDEVLDAANEAVRGLCPVTVHFGDGRIQLQSYAHRIDIEHYELCLSPIEDEGVPKRATKVYIDWYGQNTGFRLRLHSFRMREDGALGCSLSRGRLERLPEPDRPHRKHETGEPLMMVVPAGLDGIEVQVFPILGLSAEECTIDSTKAVPPGTVLDPVEILSDLYVIRRASAVVTQVTPWRSAHGTRRFHCRLKLHPADLQKGCLHDVLSDPPSIQRVLRLSALRRAGGWLDAPSLGRSPAVLTELTDNSLAVELAGSLGFSGQETSVISTRVRFGIELFAISYDMDVRLLNRTQDRLELSLPLVLRRRRRRRENRTQIPEDEAVSVRFRHPVDREAYTRQVVDISYGGICILADTEKDLAWEGLPLRDLSVTWRNGVVEVGEAHIVAVDERPDGKVYFHARFEFPRISEQPDLVDLVATLGHPMLEVTKGEDFSGMLDLYTRSGIYHDYMVPNLEPVLEEASENWLRVRDHGSDLVRTLVHRDVDRSIDATVTILRSWEYTWLLQHFGAVSSNGFRWSGELQLATLNFLVGRRDFRFAFFWVEAKNRSMNALYERFFELTGTAEAIERSEVQLWALPAGAARRDPKEFEGVVRPLLAEDESLVAHGAERAFGPMTAASLSIVPDEMGLPDTSLRYGNAGLKRDRTCFVFDDGRGPRAALLSEYLSPGLNLTWKLNATWLTPVFEDLTGSDLTQALDFIASRPRASDSVDTFALVPTTTDQEVLRALGWEQRMHVYTYIMNRAGVLRYSQYVADRYGSVGIRASRRKDVGVAADKRA
ncbi:MAG: hypothetical protein AAF355_14135 [Myxococcota bacterium]